jgi:hypothetical protein
MLGSACTRADTRGHTIHQRAQWAGEAFIVHLELHACRSFGIVVFWNSTSMLGSTAWGWLQLGSDTRKCLCSPSRVGLINEQHAS